MAGLSDSPLPDLLFAGEGAAVDRRLARMEASGRLRRVIRGVYTSILDRPLEEILRAPRLYRILAYRYPGTVLAFRSALLPYPWDEAVVFLTGRRGRSTLALPGLEVRVVPGPGPVAGDLPVVEGLYRASTERALLENLSPNRGQTGSSRALGSAAVQHRLEALALEEGVSAMEHRVRQAERLAPELGREREARRLVSISEALTGKAASRRLPAPPRILLRRQGRPADPAADARFQILFDTLRRSDFVSRMAGESPEEADNRAFVEAYFSNYIEGTEFEVDEARRVIFEDRQPAGRPVEDSHDIRGTYQLARGEWTDTVPDSPEALIEQLRERHRLLMAAREVMGPGEFKERPNYYRGYAFVDPALVSGTLMLAYEYLRELSAPMARAVFTMFAITEIHPFRDGNGRVARLTANAELSVAGQTRIIIPTRDRDSYREGLRALSEDREPDQLIAACRSGQRFTSELRLEFWEKLEAQLHSLGAF